MPRIATLALLALTALATTAAFASDLPSRKGAPVAPVAAGPACYEKEGIPTDAFGFTTGSDVNDHKALSGSLTYGGSYGTRFGSFNSHTGTLQASYGLFPCAEFGPYLVGNVTRASFDGTSADINAYGGGLEMKYKLLGRDVHGIGLTAVIDPSVTRNDISGFGNPNFTVYNTGLRLFADTTLIPGKLYAALNLSHDMTWTGPSGYFKNSTFNVGAALAYQVVDGFYLGGEVRHQRRYADLGFGREAGYATFAGPNFYWQATKALGITAAYNVQIAGKAKNAPGDLDLVNFNQHQLKVKAAYSF
jgi:hypothetical protein